MKATMLVVSAAYSTVGYCDRGSMLTTSRYLLLAFQLWAITSTRVRAQVEQLDKLEPPYQLSVIANDRDGDRVPFVCRTADNFAVEDWVLYRNGIRENTTDPCISPGRDSNDAITITAGCDGLYSCGAKYTNGRNNTGLVLSKPLAVYGNCKLLSFKYMFLFSE